MTTNSDSVASFWSRTRANLAAVYYSHHKNFWLFESSVWLHMLAGSMISIFIPILMLETGFSLQEVLVFYIVLHLVNIPTNYLAGWAVSWMGARRTIIVATLFQIAFFISYSQIEPGHWGGLLLIGSLAAVYDALYYVASMYLFMRTTIDIKNSGKNTGILNAVIRSANLIGPAIGSFILLYLGHPSWVIAVVIAVFACSTIPLFYTSLEQGERSRMMGIRDFFRTAYAKGNYLSLGLYKANEAISMVPWAIYIYLFFGSLTSVAALAILSPIVMLVISFGSGWINLRWRYHAIALGSVLLCIVWYTRFTSDSGVWLYATVVLGGLFGTLVQVPIDANIYRHGTQTNPLTASVMRNMTSMVVKACVFIVLLLLTLEINAGFIIAIIALTLLVAANIVRIHLRNRSQLR